MAYLGLLCLIDWHVAEPSVDTPCLHARERKKVGFGLRLCANTLIGCRREAVFAAAGRSGGRRARRPPSSLQSQHPGAKDLDHSLQVVSQNLQAHLSSAREVVSSSRSAWPPSGLSASRTHARPSGLVVERCLAHCPVELEPPRERPRAPTDSASNASERLRKLGESTGGKPIAACAVTVGRAVCVARHATMTFRDQVKASTG